MLKPEKRLRKPLILLLTVFSISCAVPRPNTDLCIVNAPLGHMKCYNMKRDYNSDGRLKAGATPTYRQALSIEDVNKYMAIDIDGQTNLKVYLKRLRDEYEKCKQ